MSLSYKRDLERQQSEGQDGTTQRFACVVQEEEVIHPAGDIDQASKQLTRDENQGRDRATASTDVSV